MCSNKDQQEASGDEHASVEKFRYKIYLAFTLWAGIAVSLGADMTGTRGLYRGKAHVER